MYHAISEAILREMDALEEKYSGGADITDKDLADIDKMAHALKCLSTYEAIKGAGDYDYRPRRREEYRRY